MQALTALLPQQGDAAGWAELAGFVRGRGSGGAHSSGGGVQLLSRLVAAAARRYPAEAEAAGLTERPLAPLPSLSAAGSPPAAATAAAAAAPPWAGSGAAAAAGSPGVAPATAASAANAASSRPPPPSLRQQEQHWGQVTFVAESPEAAEQLRRELGPTVTVVSESEEAAAEQPAAAGPPAAGRRPLPPPSVTLVLPSLEAYDAFWERPELNTLNVMVVAEPDYLAAFEEQVGAGDVGWKGCPEVVAFGDGTSVHAGCGEPPP